MSPLVVISITVIVAVIASAGAVWIAVQEAQTQSAADVKTAIAIASANPESNVFASLATIASVKVYRASGELIANHMRPAETLPLRDLAARFAPPDVRCEPGSQTTVCVETSPALLATRLQSALMLIAVTLFAALVAGALGSLLLRRLRRRSLAGIADVVDKAAREHDYSLRVDSSKGDPGGMTSSLNDLLAQIQDRELRLRRRSPELESANRELEAFAYSVSHHLRAPLGSIDGFAQALQMDYGDKLDATAEEYLGWIREGCHQTRDLIDGLLQMSRVTRADVRRATVDLS